MQMQTEHEQMSAAVEVLAASCHRNGGVIELSHEQAAELQREYGVPSPMLTGRDEQGVFAALFHLDEWVERATPLIMRSTGASEEVATSHAKAMLASIETAQLVLRELEAEARRNRAAANS